MFPYALASASPRIKQIMVGAPAFWTRIIILIDHHEPTPLADVDSYLEWSADLPLYILITRRHKDPSDPGEIHRTRAVIDRLRPHLHRCISLVFDLTFSSSLPTIPRDLSGDFKHLQVLKLECDFDGGDDIHTLLASQPGSGSFPALNVPSVNGENVPYLFPLKNPSRCKIAEHLFELTISHYSSRHSVYGILHFETLDDDVQGGSSNRPRLVADELHISDTPNATQLLTGLLDFLLVTKLTITHCQSFTAFGVGYLSLSELDATPAELATALSSWNGFTTRRCPA